jgi:hypothetical protein
MKDHAEQYSFDRRRQIDRRQQAEKAYFSTTCGF